MTELRSRYRTIDQWGEVEQFVTKEGRDSRARAQAARTGERIITEFWDESHPQDSLNQGWACDGFADPPGELIRLSLRIDNRYEVKERVTTTEYNLWMSAPPDETSEPEAFEEWVREHIFNRTGTGEERGNSWYDVEVIDSSRPDWVGRTFEFGY